MDFCRGSNGIFWAPSTCGPSCRYHASEIVGTISVTRIESAGSWHLQILLPSTTRQQPQPQRHAIFCLQTSKVCGFHNQITSVKHPENQSFCLLKDVVSVM